MPVQLSKLDIKIYMILFSNPDENGLGQVCVIDLQQVWKDW